MFTSTGSTLRVRPCLLYTSYQYATGFCAAVAIASRILKEGEPAVADYLKFLSSGGSGAPINLLKLAGVDLSDKAVLRRSLEEFGNTLEELKRML